MVRRFANGVIATFLSRSEVIGHRSVDTCDRRSRGLSSAALLTAVISIKKYAEIKSHALFRLEYANKHNANCLLTLAYTDATPLPYALRL